MTFSKILALALIAAIANPLCCCTWVMASMMEASPMNNASAEHSCCAESTSSKDRGQASEDHNPANCVHQHDRNSQISQATDTGDSLLKPALQFVTLLPVPELDYGHELIARKQNSFYWKKHLPPVVALSKVYCVYLT